MRALILGLVLPLSGCASLPGVIEALAKDPATVCATVTTIYGTMKVYRSAITSGSVRCDQDGLTVTPAK